MSFRNLAVFSVLSMLPVFSWFFLLFLPIIFVAGLLVTPVLLIPMRFQLKPAENLEPDARSGGARESRAYPVIQVMSREWPVGWLNALGRIMEEHLLQFAAPMRTCSCVSTQDGRVTLVTRFVAAGGAWSHSVHGATLEEALSRMSWKLRAERLRPGSALNLGSCGIKSSGKCGIFACANAARCPYRNPARGFEEVVRFETACIPVTS